MSSKAFFSVRNRFIPAFELLAAQALACSGGNQFTAGSAPDGSSSTSDDAGGTTIVANPNADTSDASAPPSGSVDATAGQPVVDASVTDASGPDASGADAGPTDAGVIDAGPDVLVCPSMGLACDGGCITNDIHNCGACGKACAVPTHGTATCGASSATYACGIACDTNYTKCGASCVDLQSDPKNCGSCGHDCIGGTCAAGKCQSWTVAQTSGNALSAWSNGPSEVRAQMVSDGKFVVWIDSTLGVLEVPVTGGSAKNMAPSTRSGTVTLGTLAIASGNVAWTVNDPSGTSVWTAKETDVANSGKSVATASAAPLPDNLALDSTGMTAYFIADPGPGSTSQSVLYKCDLASNTCVPIKNVSTAKTSAPNDVIVVGSKIYWTDSANGGIWLADYSQTAAPAAITTGLSYAPLALVADSAYLYWGGVNSSGNFTIERTPLAGPVTLQTIVSDTSGPLIGIGADGTNVYYDALGVLDYVPAAGGVSARSVHAAAPYAVAVAGGAIYWLDSDNNIYGLRFP